MCSKLHTRHKTNKETKNPTNNRTMSSMSHKYVYLLTNCSTQKYTTYKPQSHTIIFAPHHASHQLWTNTEVRRSSVHKIILRTMHALVFLCAQVLLFWQYCTIFCIDTSYDQVFCSLSACFCRQIVGESHGSSVR